MENFISETNLTANYNSRAIAPKNNQYSIQLNLSGSFDIDVEIQTSQDKTNWITLEGSSRLNVTDATEAINYDVNTGRHLYTRVLITHNSGTYSVEGLIN